MTCCTTCVTVLALLLQVIAHFMPKTELDEVGWWQFGSKKNERSSTAAAWFHSIAVFCDLMSLVGWCIYSSNRNPSSQKAKEDKEASRVSAVVSALMKGCGCGWHFCYPKPGMFWCCLSSGTSLVFSLFALCTSVIEEHEQQY